MTSFSLSVSKQIYFLMKRIFFPGFDLHTCTRYRRLPRMFLQGEVATLDAGCGNGCLGMAASRLGNKVLGISIEDKTIERNREYCQWLGHSGVEFKTHNLYSLNELGRKFDQIICSETLEHIADDRKVIQGFANILKDGGVLHLCCPYSLHPGHNLGRTSEPETGGHVRDGYTLESYRELLEPAGFKVISHVGLGSSFLCKADHIIRFVRNRFGDIGALPLYLVFGWWAVLLDDFTEPSIPFSLYVQAIKET